MCSFFSRLWYRQRCIKSSTPIVLNFMDFMPRYLNPGEKHPRFETLSEVLEKANERIKQFPIQGKLRKIRVNPRKDPKNPLLNARSNILLNFLSSEFEAGKRQIQFALTIGMSDNAYKNVECLHWLSYKMCIEVIQCRFTNQIISSWFVFKDLFSKTYLIAWLSRL